MRIIRSPNNGPVTIIHKDGREETLYPATRNERFLPPQTKHGYLGERVEGEIPVNHLIKENLSRTHTR